MNKDTTKIIFSILTLVAFLASTYYIYLGGFANQTKQIQSQSVNGISDFNATLRFYESFIKIPSINQSLISKISQNPQVEDVFSDKDGYIVSIKDRQNVPTVYKFLTNMGLRGQSQATLQAPDTIYLNTADGLIPIQSNSLLLKYYIEPIFDIGANLSLRMVAVAQDGALIQYNNPTISTASFNQSYTGTIDKLVLVSANYYVPWEKRSEFDPLKLNIQENVTFNYTKKNFALFNKSLTIEQMKSIKLLSYVTFISDKVAYLNSSFADKNVLLSDLNRINVSSDQVILPDSVLTFQLVKDVSAINNLGLNFSNSLVYTYKINISELENVTDYIPNGVLNKSYAPGQTISVSVTGSEVGGRLIVDTVTVK